MPDGRFAPSPTGELHLGNLRTALVAWLFARSGGSRFVVRMEDLDPVTSGRDHERSQLADLAAIGVDWDGEVVRQSERFALHHRAIDTLVSAGLTYRCTCTRREMREAASAPHGHGPDDRPPAVVGHRCRDRPTRGPGSAERLDRPAAVRLRTEGEIVRFVDGIAGAQEGPVDDVVLRRNDGVPAYNLAVVVDDHLQGIGEVVRGDDLLAATPGQIHLARLLGQPVPAYAHVALVLGPDGSRLAKRHGAVTLAACAAAGERPPQVLARIAASLGLGPGNADGAGITAADLLGGFERGAVRSTVWTVTFDR